MKKLIIAVVIGCMFSCDDEVTKDPCSELYDKTMEAADKMHDAYGTAGFEAAADEYWALRKQYAQQCR